MRTNRLSIELLSETNPFVYLMIRSHTRSCLLKKATNAHKEAYCKFVNTAETPVTRHR